MRPTNEWEQQIDNALRVMNETIPPDGMQARVLGRANRAVDLEPASHASLWWSAAVACSLVALAGVAIARRDGPVERNEAAHVSRAPIVDLASAGGAARNAAPHDIPVVAQQEKPVLVTVHRPWGAHAASRPDAQADQVTAEMFAPSKPAPELPLTQQEKLLLAAARGREAKSEVAELRRPVWPLHDPADDDDFYQFFTRPTAPTQPGDSE